MWTKWMRRRQNQKKLFARSEIELRKELCSFISCWVFFFHPLTTTTEMKEERIENLHFSSCCNRLWKNIFIEKSYKSLIRSQHTTAHKKALATKHYYHILLHDHRGEHSQ
jgi:hypothetical protein